MAELDTRSVEQKIIDALNGPGEIREPREYLGYSGIGHHCMRSLWYGFRWCHFQHMEGRILRLFGRGFHEEKIIAKELQRIGADIINDQVEVVGFEKHVKGHIDGIIVNTPWFNEDILGEVKTYNDKRFKALVKLGVKVSDYTYYAQVQSYMGKLNLKIALFIATNKNDDHRHVEIIEFDPNEFDKLEARAISIVTTDFPPAKIGTGMSTWFQCKICNYKGICHYGEKINKNCRTCAFGTIIEDGKWKCAKNGPDWHDLPKDVQLKGCVNWEKLETL